MHIYLEFDILEKDPFFKDVP